MAVGIQWIITEECLSLISLINWTRLQCRKSSIGDYTEPSLQWKVFWSNSILEIRSEWNVSWNVFRPIGVWILLVVWHNRNRRRCLFPQKRWSFGTFESTSFSRLLVGVFIFFFIKKSIKYELCMIFIIFYTVMEITVVTAAKISALTNGWWSMAACLLKTNTEVIWDRWKSLEILQKYTSALTVLTFQMKFVQDGYCHADNVTLVAPIKGFVNVTSSDPTALRVSSKINQNSSKYVS